MTDKELLEFEVGDIVQVFRPEMFISSFGKKVADRDAVVLWIGPDKHGQFKGSVKVRFLKRNGRGKEFEEIMSKRDFILKSKGNTK
jgi:hypothetical protein